MVCSRGFVVRQLIMGYYLVKLATNRLSGNVYFCECSSNLDFISLLSTSFY